jgi:hypothetical protein
MFDSSHPCQFRFEPIAFAIASINRSAENGFGKNAAQPSSMACRRCNSSRDPVMNIVGNVSPFAERRRLN